MIERGVCREALNLFIRLKRHRTVRSIDLVLRLPESMQLPVPEAVSTAVVREEVLSWQLREETDALCFLSLVIGEIEPIRAAVNDLAIVNRSDFTRIDKDTFYVYAEMDVRGVDHALWDAIDPHVIPVPPIVYTDAGTIEMTMLGDEEALGSAVDGLPNEITVTVARVGDYRHSTGSPASRLTHRQFEALTVARDMGYYEVPRETALNDVAAALDCSESAASTLLRNGERALVNAAVGR